jgi:hypothetical protein
LQNENGCKKKYGWKNVNVAAEVSPYLYGKALFLLYIFLKKKGITLTDSKIFSFLLGNSSFFSSFYYTLQKDAWHCIFAAFTLDFLFTEYHKHSCIMLLRLCCMDFYAYFYFLAWKWIFRILRKLLLDGLGVFQIIKSFSQILSNMLKLYQKISELFEIFELFEVISDIF